MKKVYKTSIYILSDFYIKNGYAPHGKYTEKTELEVLVVPNYRLGYAKEIITGIKIPVLKTTTYRDISDDTVFSKSKPTNIKGELLAYFIPSCERRISFGGLISEVDNRSLGEATTATMKDLVHYRQKHSNTKDYRRTLKFIFSGYEERLQMLKEKTTSNPKKLIKQ